MIANFVFTNIKMLYCLQIEMCYPHYKRPYTCNLVKHYKTFEQANEKRREEKAKYYEQYLEHLKENGEEVPKDVDDIDEDESQDYFYKNSYMDMAPFSAAIYEIVIEDDAIIKTRMPFPTSISSGESIEIDD
jgi:hypothetical protein